VAESNGCSVYIPSTSPSQDQPSSFLLLAHGTQIDHCEAGVDDIFQAVCGCAQSSASVVRLGKVRLEAKRGRVLAVRHQAATFVKYSVSANNPLRSSVFKMYNLLWSFDVHIATLWRANPILFTLGLCAVGFGTMNISSTMKTARARGKRARMLEEKLDLIPRSHLTGINTLPVELWSQIIECVLDPHLQQKRQCYAVPQILKMRLVCRKFCYTRARSSLC
jgi:hypothetical protein